MVVVENDKCVSCGLCAKLCHEQCIRLTVVNGNKGIQIDSSLCSTCTQCIAVCPRQALSWNGVLPLVYEKDRLPSVGQLDELLKQRRTIREYKKAKIDRALLGEIIQSAIYAPTNNFHLRVIVVDSKAEMHEFDTIILRFVSRVYNLFYKPMGVFKILKAISPLVNQKQKVKLERALERGSAFESMPAAMIFIVGDPRILKSEASAQYAVYNIVLYAQLKGVGSRISAAGVLTLDKNRRVRKTLKLRKYEHILGCLDLGFPAIRFRNKVEGKAIPVVWTGEPEDG